MRTRVTLVAVGTLLVSLLPNVSGAAPGSARRSGRPAVPRRARCRSSRRVADLLGRMTLEEKIGQMTQAERGAVADDPTLIAQLAARLGALRRRVDPGARTRPAAWVAMVNAFQAQALSTRLQIPLIYGIDAVHGHGNVLRRHDLPAQHRPRRDPRPRPGASGSAHATAAEVRATGIPWNFSPCVCVARDERWGRTYESFGEDPALVIRMETIIDGLQGRRPSSSTTTTACSPPPSTTPATATPSTTQAIAAANVGKPWYEQRYTIDQGITVTSRRRLRAAIDLAPVPAGDRAGTTSAASCRRSPASTGPRTASATRSRCTPTAS